LVIAHKPTKTGNNYAVMAVEQVMQILINFQFHGSNIGYCNKTQHIKVHFFNKITDILVVL
jgi:hypothetical protein